jgi:CheY-like chemotaxis protein/curved DNA-binding protein CbpA
MAANPEEVEERRRILCAFRNPALRQRLEQRLEAGGYATSTVGSPMELVDAVVRETPDLVLLDGKLGGGEEDGIGLLEAIRESGAVGAEVAAVLFSSGENAGEVEERARSLDAQVYRGRKIGSRELRSLIEQALGGPEDARSEGELLSLCERLRDENPFAALGLAASAQPAEIRRAYEQLHRWLHPDALVQASSELRRVAQGAFADLLTTYAKLSDPESLEVYRADPERDRQVSLEDEEAGPSPRAEQAYREGRELLDRQDWMGAFTSFERAVAMGPANGEYRAYLGWATYLAYGAESAVLREAIGHAKEGAKLSPEHFAPVLILGRLYQFTSRLDLASKAFDRAVSLNPDSVEAVRELRIMRMRQDRKSARGLISRLLRR